MKSLALLAVILTLPLHSFACERPQPPPEPNRKAISTDDLYASIDEIQLYFSAARSYIECMENEGDSQEVVDEANNIIEFHNERMRAYRDRIRVGQQEEIDKQPYYLSE